MLYFLVQFLDAKHHFLNQWHENYYFLYILNEPKIAAANVVLGLFVLCIQGESIELGGYTVFIFTKISL
jgi:hypothetical protein